MGPLPDALARVPAREPTWVHPEPAAPDRAAADSVLAALAEEDRRVLVLSHGFGLALGDVAYALHLDASVVSWRLRRALAGRGASPAAVERGLAALLRERVERARSGAAPLPAQLPDDVGPRLEARLAGVSGPQAARAGGLGVGSLVLIVLAAAGFMVYGAIRDVNPLWRGFRQVREHDYTAARQSFLEMGPSGEARMWVGLCWLAEAEFDRGIEALRDPLASEYLGRFQLVEAPLPPYEGDAESPALLPRGLISITRPRFVFRPVPAGTLRLEVTSTALGTDKPRTVDWAVPDTTGSTLGVFEYPAEAPAMLEGKAVWWAPGGEERPASFTVVNRTDLATMKTELERLSHDIPRTARDFLRGQYFLRNELYMQAGEQFARLAREFPEQPWPRQAVGRAAAALGVDPAVFLR
jgi:hypothetical protein